MEDKILKIAKKAAVEAGKIIISLRGSKLVVRSKERIGDFGGFK